MTKLFRFLIPFLLASSIIFSQGTAGTSAKYEYRNLIDMPVAGVLEKGFSSVGFEFMPYGTMISVIEVGVFDNFSFGISYGGSNIIGTGKVEWYKWPGINVRFRILDESPGTPALLIGFDSQGKGLYQDSLSRYEVKSPGFFGAVAKTFDFLGYLSLHGVINYSLETKDKDKDFNLQIGAEQTIGTKVSLVAEYDFAINDNTGNSIGSGNGYLNMGLRWSVVDGLTLGLDLRNLLDNKKFNSNKADRSIKIEYVKAIF